jgi:hypothetical protein
MISKLSSTQIQELLRLRETGMGFQFIEAELGMFGSKRKFLVLNSQMILEDSRQILGEVKSVFNDGYKFTLSKASEVELKNIKLVENLSNVNLRQHFASKEIGAVNQKIESANGIDIFSRLSAYENDLRVDMDKEKLLPGSFATTYSDYSNCKNNNLNPVERYALPNDEDIKFVFHFKPKIGDYLQRGIVEPANNQIGGGKEVFFVNGTSDFSLLKKTEY